MRIRHLIAFASSATLLASPAAAQRMVGEIVDAAGAPVVGAFIRLLDDDGVFIRGVLSDTAGRFSIDLAEPGRYRVRAERIGHVSVDAGPFDALADQVIPVHLESGTQAIALTGIEIEGEKRCTTRPDRAAGAATVWEEARKALELTLWSKDNSEIRYRSTVYSRELDPNLDIRNQSLRPVSSSGYRSFRTVESETLEEYGFARMDGDSIDYYGLDAEVLLSDWFLDTHCFELTVGEDTSVVGLRFRPVRNRGRPDVEGTLWVEKSSGRLRWLDYSYLQLRSVFPAIEQVVPPSDPRIPPVRMTARTSFRRLDGGLWIVDDWWIRLPLLMRQRGRILLNGWSVRGGVVLEAWQALGKITSEPDRGRLLGRRGGAEQVVRRSAAPTS